MCYASLKEQPKLLGRNAAPFKVLRFAKQGASDPHESYHHLPRRQARIKKQPYERAAKTAASKATCRDFTQGA